MSGSPLVILATGGTGGHVYPALALAAELQRHGVRTLLVGARGGIEERLSEEAGVRFEGVPAGKLDRSRPDPRELYRALKGLTRARGIVRREKPKLVIGFGGFASLPAAAAAAWSGVPLWLNEQNAYPGLVTRLLARRAELVVASVSAALTRLRARNTMVLPYPVDETPFTRQEARKLLGLPEEGLLTLVMGGSQGAVALNVAVVRAAHALGERFPLTLHVTGPNNHADVLRCRSTGLKVMLTAVPRSRRPTSPSPARGLVHCPWPRSTAFPSSWFLFLPPRKTTSTTTPAPLRRRGPASCLSRRNCTGSRRRGCGRWRRRAFRRQRPPSARSAPPGRQRHSAGQYWNGLERSPALEFAFSFHGRRRHQHEWPRQALPG